MNEPRAIPARTRSTARPLVFVVDDEPMLLELATVILEPLGFEMATFRDAETALHAFAGSQVRPDLLITDYAMHCMNGMDLIRECRRLKPEQKVLLISGTVGPEVFHHASAKPDRFLAKPYQARELISLVTVMLTC